MMKVREFSYKYFNVWSENKADFYLLGPPKSLSTLNKAESIFITTQFLSSLKSLGYNSKVAQHERHSLSTRTMTRRKMFRASFHSWYYRSVVWERIFLLKLARQIVDLLVGLGFSRDKVVIKK